MKDYSLMKMPIESIAIAMANCGDDEQSLLLNTFAKELRILCRANHEAQLCAISRSLDGEGVQLVKELYEFIKLREESR